MASQYEEYDDDDFAEDNGPANLRKALKKAEKQRKELEDQLVSLQSSLRERSVKDVLDTKGVNPKIASFIPKDVTAPEQIAAWLDEHADVFGFQTQQSSAPEITEEARSSQRIDNAISNASSPSHDEDVMSKLRNVGSKEELDRLIFGDSYKGR
jgi:predicted flap endonuclease-1-like 5' DNA nuclease